MADENSRCKSNVNRFEGSETAEHLTERQLVDYVQQEIDPTNLHPVNSHLIACSDCAERLSALILFAAENDLLKTEEESVIDDFLTSSDYNLMKSSFIGRAIDTYKNKGFHLIKRFVRKRRRISFSFSFDIK